ncbi:hypothetical protein RRG08_043795 [Elysia crispata]|uniref:Uncharacterized protein n=1 Tax=Elysia crispata TaxID=231223 RepID=A0AAE1DAV9_9GAST|nr:hypothetical protein RRG08_043795 [Elysia crispata]
MILVEKLAHRTWRNRRATLVWRMKEKPYHVEMTPTGLASGVLSCRPYVAMYSQEEVKYRSKLDHLSPADSSGHHGVCVYVCDSNWREVTTCVMNLLYRLTL